MRIPKTRAKNGQPVIFGLASAPPEVRKTKTPEEALPGLYLNGIFNGAKAQFSMLFWVLTRRVVGEYCAQNPKDKCAQADPFGSICWSQRSRL